MAVLAYSHIEDERYVHTHYPNASCLQCVLAAVARDWTGDTTWSAVRVDGAIHGGPQGNTIEQGSAFLTSLGIPNHYSESEPMSSYLPRCIEARHRVIIEHQCDTLARPVRAGTSRIRHFRDGFGLEGTGASAGNPWGGLAPDRQTLSALLAADTHQHIEITGIMPADRGGDAVTEGEKIALVELAFAVARPLTPYVTGTAEAAVHYQNEVLPHAALIADDGSNAHSVVGGIIYSKTEGQREQLVAMLGHGGSPGLVPVHTHPLTGSTGESA